jgi:hypothetical protein
MTEQIFVESVELNNASGVMASTIECMSDIQNTILRIHGQKTSIWHGRAATQSTINFEALDAMMQGYLMDAFETKMALDAAVATYGVTETTQAAKVSQLDTQGIF